MTTEEKLQHFTSVTIESVQKECDEMLAEYKKKMEDYFEDHKVKSIEKSKLATSIAEDGIKRKASQEYTSMQMHLKRKINHKQEELKEKLFDEVNELLRNYISTNEYKEYVLKKVDEIKRFAGSDELIIELDPNDKDLADDIMPKANMKVVVSERTFMGGVKGSIPKRNILIDDSFETKFEEIKDKYTIAGGR